MKRLARLLGTLAFFAVWPALYVYLRHGSERTRILVVLGDDVLVSVNWLSNGRWSLPGGGLHKGEDRLTGALRELREETGLTPKPEELQYMLEAKVHGHGLWTTFYCYVLVLDEKPSLVRQRHEVAEHRWINYHDLSDRNTSSEALQLVQAWFKESALIQ